MIVSCRVFPQVRAKHVKTAPKPAKTPKMVLPLSPRRNSLPEHTLSLWLGLWVGTKVRGFALFLMGRTFAS